MVGKSKILGRKTVPVFGILLGLFILAGCSGSDDGTESPEDPTAEVSPCIENGALGNVTENHGHELTIPKEDVIAAKEKTYSIQGFADHDHTLTLKPADFTALKNSSGSDIYSSTTNGHRHSVFVLCAP